MTMIHYTKIHKRTNLLSLEGFQAIYLKAPLKSFTVIKTYLKVRVPWALKEQWLGSNVVSPSFPPLGYLAITKCSQMPEEIKLGSTMS